MINNDPELDSELQFAARHLEVEIEGDPAFGWGRKTIGSRVKNSDGETLWLRLQYGEAKIITSRAWNGVAESFRLKGIKKPRVISQRDWESQGCSWRAVLMDFVAEVVCSKTPELRTDLDLSETWFEDLRTSLENLSHFETERVTCRQDLITRRVGEYFGSDVSVDVDDWITCHGDLHWSNLTCPKLTILDWDVWGTGPRGLDPSLLIGFSLHQPEVVRRIDNTFHDWLHTKSGLISKLFVAAELLRMIELYGDHVDLEGPLRSWADTTIEKINGY